MNKKSDSAEKPSKLKIILSISFFVVLFGIVKFTDNLETNQSTHGDRRSEKVKSILTDLGNAGVNISKDVTRPEGIMLFLDRQWKSVTFNDTPESGETFYISAPTDKDYVEVSFWFHIPATSSKNVRKEIGAEMSALLTNAQFENVNIKAEALTFLRDAIDAIDSRQNSELSFVRGPYSIKLTAVQDQEKAFLVQLGIKGPI